MGRPSAAADDEADRHVESDLAIGDTTAWLEVRGIFNVILTLAGGAAGTCIVETTADGGSTVAPCGAFGNAVTLTAPLREQMESREIGLLHRVRRMTGNGVLHARISQ